MVINRSRTKWTKVCRGRDVTFPGNADHGYWYRSWIIFQWLVYALQYLVHSFYSDESRYSSLKHRWQLSYYCASMCSISITFLEKAAWTLWKHSPNHGLSYMVSWRSGTMQWTQWLHRSHEATLLVIVQLIMSKRHPVSLLVLLNMNFPV